MEWIRFSDQIPPEGEIIIYDGDVIVMGWVDKNGKIKSDVFYCNDKKCNYIYDDCGCHLIITDECYWMKVPQPPF